MIVKPKVKNYICLTAHPEGCEEQVRSQIRFLKGKRIGREKTKGPRTLVIGSSTGYGLSSRICAAWLAESPTIGVCYERPASEKRTATAGWYNAAAFQKLAAEDGLYAKTIIGDAFSKKIKEQTIEMIRRDWGQVDLVIYSLAAPRRTMEDGSTYTSVLKTIGDSFTSKSVDLEHQRITEKTVYPATEEEISATVHVMGGEDWANWMTELKEAGVLSESIRTIAYSYLGPELTYPIYQGGTIGRAKEHLYQTALTLTEKGIPAWVSVNKALVTQSSAAIPIVPLYIMILYRVMKEAGSHETAIGQMYRLWNDFLMKKEIETDRPCMIRLDDKELAEEIQIRVKTVYEQISDENLRELADVDGYWEDFYHLFGFLYSGVDYEKDVNIDAKIVDTSTELA